MSRESADLTGVTDKLPPEADEDLEDMALRDDYDFDSWTRYLHPKSANASFLRLVTDLSLSG